MVTWRRTPKLRSVGLVLVGVLLGATVVAPVVARDAASEAARSTPTGVTSTRAVSCQGMNFHPIDHATGYSYQGTRLIRLRGDGTAYGTGYFLCDPGLPHKAVVKRIQFTLYDNHTTGEVRYCGLYRAGLATTTATPSELMASVPATGPVAKPGTVRLASSSITSATVDNTRWAYWLQCQILSNIDTASAVEVGIYGANVVYTITAANG